MSFVDYPLTHRKRNLSLPCVGVDISHYFLLLEHRMVFAMLF